VPVIFGSAVFAPKNISAVIKTDRSSRFVFVLEVGQTAS
jgi:hypothetical protein